MAEERRQADEDDLVVRSERAHPAQAGMPAPLSTSDRISCSGFGAACSESPGARQFGRDPTVTGHDAKAHYRRTLCRTLNSFPMLPPLAIDVGVRQGVRG